MSPWFLPEKETCDISYSLEGIPERADKVAWEVLPDRYVAASAPRAGADYAESVLTPSEVPVRQSIRLSSFYPRWKRPAAAGGQPILDDTTLKIKWKVENCTVLKHGQLLIWDKNSSADRPLHRVALGSGDLSQGDHEFDWTAGKTIVKLGELHYRIQIQAHTDVDDDDGVAIAAMHTRVAVHSIALEIGDFEKGIFDNGDATNKGQRERLKSGNLEDVECNPMLWTAKSRRSRFPFVRQAAFVAVLFELPQLVFRAVTAGAKDRRLFRLEHHS